MLCRHFHFKTDLLSRLNFSPLRMSLSKSYVTWNNKGGVGKTTLTFHMATQYALDHSDENVLVIDLCPQANVSMALIRKKNVSGLTSQGRTISFYLKNQINQVTGSRSPINPQEFLTQVSFFNHEIPPNVLLLCGDIHLEIVARSLEKTRNADAEDDSNWVSLSSCVRCFIEGNFLSPGVTTQRYGNNSKWVVFIDTNPSFSVYTEIALLAADRLIIPVNADDFSREALNALLYLVYGIADDQMPYDLKFDEHMLSFSDRAKTHGLRLPRIHMLVHNRATRYNLRSAQAFNEMAESIRGVLNKLAETHKTECFYPKFPSTLNQYCEDMYDFHTAGVVALHLGWPLATLANLRSLNQVPVLQTTVQLNRHQINSHLQCLQNLVNKL